MIGAISNPKKEISFPKGISDVKKALGDLQTYLTKIGAKNYKQEFYDEFIGELKLSTFEFLSLGVIIIFNVKKQDEDNTIINIEVQRKVGAFDKTYEITNANKHLNYMTNVLSSLLRNPSMDMEIAAGHNLVKTNVSSSENSTSSVVAILWLIFFFPFGLYYMWNYKIWSKTTRYVISALFGLLVIKILMN